MKKSSLDKTAERVKSIIDNEDKFTYSFFLIALRNALGRTKQVVAYDLELDYDDLWRHEEERMSKRFNSAKNQLLAEYYGVDPDLLEKKFREWQNTSLSNITGIRRKNESSSF